MTRFNKEALLVDEVDDKVLTTAFTNGLQSEVFLFSINKNYPKTMVNMLYKTTYYMNVEEAMIAREEIKTSTWEDRQLHTTEYPARPSPHANKGRCGIDLARQAKGQSEQKA